jgi:beta-glucuronidase
MTRRFREHDERSVAVLDGIWDFVFLGDIELDGLDLQAIDYPDRMAVPGCFDATPAYAGQRGLAAYRTQIEILDESPHRLVFNSVQNWCRVFVNGQLLGEHANGFTRFTFDVASQPVGPADLVVLVDNRLNTTKAPLHLDYFDWYHFGGIDSPVTLERLGLLWINDLQVETVAIDPPTLALRVAYSAVEQVNEVVLRIIVNGEVQHEETVNPDETAGVLERRLTLPGAALWSPDAPNLHELYVQLGEDDLRERVGIRQVAVQGRQILINDKPVRLLGFCRHEAHPQFGSALPEAIMISDIQLLRDMGCNFVRGSHYPQDVRFLDLCDEVGLCVWNEVIGWQHKAEHLTDPNFMAAQQTNLDEIQRFR